MTNKEWLEYNGFELSGHEQWAFNEYYLSKVTAGFGVMHARMYAITKTLKQVGLKKV
jgi:hypothetical protein